jgi:uncharacterized membrane protein YgcG
VTRDLDALLGLDRALDELAVGGEPAAARAAGEAADLATLAAELRAAVPAAPRGAAARGRAALLASAATPPRTSALRRRRFARARVLAAALALGIAVPAALAGRALPGTPLWPLRQAGQQVRLGLTADPVDRAHLRLNSATLLLAAARDSGGYRRAGLAACREQIQAALAQLGGRSGPGAAAERARAEGLLADLDALERSAGEGEQRRGPDPGRDDDRSGPGGGGSGGHGGSGGSGGPGGSGGSGAPGDG